MNITEVINQPADSYDPNPNTAYKQATQDSTPKYDWDPEKDYRPGKPLGPIPTIQSQTEVYAMPNQDIYIFYAKDNVVEPRETFWAKIKAWFSANTGPATGPSKDKNILGFLKLGQFEDGVKVKGVGLDSSIQGQGKAIKLYIAFSAWKKLPIYSDFTQTPSAKHMWTSLIKRYPAKVVAYDQQTKKNIPLDQAGELYHDYAPVTPKHPEKYSKQSSHQVGQTNKQTLLLKFLPESIAEDGAGGGSGGAGGGGAGSGAGAGTGGGGGAGNGSGGGASGGASGGGGEAGTGSGFVAADTMGMGTLSTYSKPKKKKKKKKTKVDFGASVYEGYFKNLDIERQERPSQPTTKPRKNPMKSPNKGNWSKLVWLKDLNLSGSYTNADLKVMGFIIKNGEWAIQEPAYNKIKNQLR